jgi:amino acid adenylation domain-containing protein
MLDGIALFLDRSCGSSLALLAPGRRSISYQALSDFVVRTSSILRAAGIAQTDLVATVLPDGPDMVSAFLAIGSVATCAPLNPGYPAKEFEFYLRDLQPKALVVQAGCASPAIDIARSMGTLVIELEPGSTAGEFSLPRFPEKAATCSHPGSDTIALVLYTSGTTSRPKRVLLSHGNLRASAENIAKSLALTVKDRCLNVMPLFHIHGLVGAALSSLSSGASLVCPGSFQAPLFFDWLDEFSPTWYTAVPTIHRSILARAEGRGVALSSLRFIRSSSSALAPQLMSELETTFGVPVVEAYGMTEASHQMAINPLPPGTRKPASVGLPYGTEIVTWDESGRVLPPGESGEIAIRGAGVTAGYAGPDGTRFGVTPDGWLATGDLGRLDAEGYLFLTGRKKEIINRGGEKISPREVEEELLNHPGVADAVVFALPDPRLGEDVAALIVRRPGSTVSEWQIREFAESRLAAFKTPRAVFFREEIPKGPTGKVQRIGLAERLGISLTASASAEAPVYVAPGNPVEEELAADWRDLLRCARVGVLDRFLDSGGDSLLAARLVSRMRDRYGIDVPLARFFDCGTVRALAHALIKDIADGQSQLRQPPIAKAPHDADQVLSFPQRRFWFLDLMDVACPAYQRPLLLRLTGALELGRVELALRRLVERHESLRTVFPSMRNEPRQRVLPPAAVKVERVEPGALSNAALRRLDLANGTVFRAFLAQVSSEEQHLLLVTHHIVFDDWSERILLEEFAQFYADPHTALAELPVQATDFAVWQQERVLHDDFARALTYWQRELEGQETAEVPPDHPRPAVQSFRGARVARRLPAELWLRLQSFGRAEGVTMFTALLAALQIVLRQYTGADAVNIGTPTSGRIASELEGLIGAFVNTLVHRSDLSGDLTVRGLLARTRSTVLEAQRHQEVPFERLVEALAPLRDLSRTPLFQVLFQLRDTADRIKVLPGLRVEPIPLDLGIARFDIALEVVGHGTDYECVCEYNTDLFRKETIERLLDHYVAVLTTMPVDALQPIADLDILGESERRKILIEWNQTESALPCLNLHEMFARQAERTPEEIAIESDGTRLSYRELARMAETLAQRLRGEGVAIDTPVGICAKRGAEMIVAVLGVLYAGGACLPLDPEYPATRLELMLRESRAALTLMGDGLPQSVLEGWSGRRKRIADVGASADAFSPLEPSRVSSPESLAYVIFTSGSTGIPKSIAMSHGPVANLVAWQLKRDRHAAKTLQFAPLSFDVAFQEIFTTLASGGTLVLIPESLRQDLSGLWKHIETQSIERLFLPNVALQALVEIAQAERRFPRALREIISAGEQLRITEPVRNLFRNLPDCRLENQYGPAETHVVTSFLLEGEPQSWPLLAPIGRPIANARMFILNPEQRPVPIGVPGEIYIGGPVLARGYLHRPDLTAERFLHGLFAGDSEPRLYRTGDRGRFLPSGDIEFLGRMDQQVKVRGYRIEPAEIEAQLESHPSIRSATVMERAGRLVAYVAFADGHTIPPRDLTLFLKTRLPEPMIPGVFVVLDRIPLLPSGKVDRGGLPEPGRDGTSVEGGFEAPASDVGKRLAAIWSEVLGVKQVGLDDNFFDLGGHSLSLARVHSRIVADFGNGLTMIDLFQYPTVRTLSGTLEGKTANPSKLNSVADRSLRQRRAYERRPQGA